MQNPCKQIACILNRRLIDPDLDVDRATVDIVRVGVAVGRTLSDDALVTFALVFLDDVLKRPARDLKHTAELLESRRCQFPGHSSSLAERM